MEGEGLVVLVFAELGRKLVGLMGQVLQIHGWQTSLAPLCVVELVTRDGNQKALGFDQAQRPNEGLHTSHANFGFSFHTSSLI